MYSATRGRGFTLIELLVVMSVISILLTILYASFAESRAAARDSQRKTDLKQLQLAIEFYEAQHGEYPAPGCNANGWVGPGPHSAAWGTGCDEWITGLVPEFIDELPVDPNNEASDNEGFMYRTENNNTEYKLVLRNTIESQTITSYQDKFARCPYSCGNSYCSDGGPPARVLAVYSLGAECW